MSSQFDEKLIQQIRDTFDNYEDNQADYGWLELRKKYPAQKHRKSAFYYWAGSAAAVLLLAFGIWVISNNASLEPINKKDENTALTGRPPGHIRIESQKNTAEKQIIQPGTVENKTQAYSYTSNTAQNIRASVKSLQTMPGAPAGISDMRPEDNYAPNTSVMQTEILAMDTVTAAAKTGSGFLPADKDKTVLAQNTVEVSAKRSLTDIAMEPSDKNEEKNEVRKLSFSVYAGSFISYADGSSNKVNLGAGFSSDIVLAKNLRLSAGLALSKNDLSFKSEIPLTARNSFTSAYNSPHTMMSSLKVISYDLEGYDASLLGLDIPVNLTYVLDEKKNELFVSAGISSGTFITESYTYYYQSRGAGNGRLPEAAPAFNKDEVQSELGGFEFARMLNFSIGMGYPVGKQNKLIVEPFLKYPLKGIGEENLRFGTGGINLKFNFKK